MNIMEKNELSISAKYVLNMYQGMCGEYYNGEVSNFPLMNFLTILNWNAMDAYEIIQELKDHQGLVREFYDNKENVLKDWDKDLCNQGKRLFGDDLKENNIFYLAMMKNHNWHEKLCALDYAVWLNDVKNNYVIGDREELQWFEDDVEKSIKDALDYD